MRFLADENVPRPIVVWLRSQGQDMLSAAETRVQTSDADLLRITLPRGRRPRRAGNGDRPAARTQRRQPKVRRGVRVRRPTRPAGPTLRLAGPSLCPTRDDDLDLAARSGRNQALPDSGGAGDSPRAKCWRGENRC